MPDQTFPSLPPADFELQTALTARAQEANDRLWGDVLAEATRRLFHDPLLVARVRAVAGLIHRDRSGAFARTWSTRDEHLAEWAAAVALVVAERPELITGSPVDRRPPAELIARILTPIVPHTGPPGQPARGPRLAEEIATTILQALELSGWEITARADRFAHLEREVAQLRIPLRGRCGVCTGEVSRGIEVGAGDAIVGRWQHINPDAPHRDGAISDVVWA